MEVDTMGNLYNTKKDLLRELAEYNLCAKEAISNQEAQNYIGDDDSYVDYAGSNYLCKMDNLVNTRILFRIFKCVNFIKNVVLAGARLRRYRNRYQTYQVDFKWIIVTIYKQTIKQE
jgi:hypothetical protein